MTRLRKFFGLSKNIQILQKKTYTIDEHKKNCVAAIYNFELSYYTQGGYIYPP
jgi:hypothetical protein